MPEQPDGVLAQLRRRHEEQELALLRKHGALSRSEFGNRSGLSRTTLHDVISGPVANGTVVELPPQQAAWGHGRPAVSLSLNPAAGRAIGIDFVRRRVHVAIVNGPHEILGSANEAANTSPTRSG